MKTAKEILQEHEDISYMWGMLTVIEAMKDYGRQCSEQALKDAAERVTEEYWDCKFLKSDLVAIINKTPIVMP